MGSVETFFLTGNNLPSMPEVARQLIASFDDEDIDLGTIVELVSREQSLALKVLRLANSARYARTRSVTRLGDAAALLGMVNLRNLVLAASIASAFPRVAGLDRLSFWKHAIATGGYARWLARILGVDPDGAYLAGFMLRSGQLLMAGSMADAISRVEMQCTAPGVRMSLEEHILACNHAQVTAELARRWKLPPRLIDAFQHAGDPLEARPFSLLAAVLNLAAAAADVGALGIPVGAGLASANTQLLQYLRLDVPWLQSTSPNHQDLIAPVDEMLG